MMKIKLILLLIISLSIFGCKKDVDEQAKIDEQIILDYLAEHNIDAIATGTGLYYLIQVEGEGDDHPNVNSTVEIYYKGYLTDGSVFDKRTATLPLYNVIQGWKEGLRYFKRGSVGKLFIPSKLGYGPTSRTGIPANSVLIFDIHLIDF